MAVLVLQLAATDLGTGGRLSQHSLFMSRVGGSFYRADAATTFAELGVLAGMLAAAGAVLALRQENHAALVGCSGLVFCLGVIGLAWFGAAQSLFSGTQIGTFLNFSHRTLYYLPLYGALAGALTLKTGIQYVERLPSWRPLLKRAAHAGLVALVLVLLVVTRLPRQEAGMKAFEAIEPESQAELYQWITQNNKQSAVFATNYLDLDQWLRYYPRARSVLSASMEDIAAPDFMTRIELYSLLFSRGNTPDSDRLDALLDTYGVGYVVVNRAPFYFDLGQNQLVNRIPDNASYQFYLTSFQASPFFEEAWRSASGDTVVYEVTRDG
jgi:hypothetical protein